MKLPLETTADTPATLCEADASAENALWQQCWRDKDKGIDDFHQKSTNPLLMQCWPALALPPAAPVFVPLCGKSLDLHWLLAQGHPVLGVELSPLAVRACFKSHKLQPRRTVQGEFTCWTAGQLRILCGDFFRLTAAELCGTQAVYDRAALTALPEALRLRYAGHLGRILPAESPMLLLTTEEAEAGESEIPALSREVLALYGAQFEVMLAACTARQARFAPDELPVPVEDKAYLLYRKTG